MKFHIRLIAIPLLTLALAGCSETLGGLALVSTAVTGFMTAGSENKDYSKYADTCRLIVSDIVAVTTAKYNTIGKAIESNNPYVQGSAMTMMAYENQRDSNLFARCQLQGPESFLQTIFKNANVPNFLLALYQENRADSRAQRQLEVARQLGLAQMDHAETMQTIQNELLTDLAGRPTENFNAGANAARPPASTTTVPAVSE